MEMLCHSAAVVALGNDHQNIQVAVGPCLASCGGAEEDDAERLDRQHDLADQSVDHPGVGSHGLPSQVATADTRNYTYGRRRCASPCHTQISKRQHQR